MVSRLSYPELSALSHWSTHGRAGHSQSNSHSHSSKTSTTPNISPYRVLPTDWKITTIFSRPVTYKWTISLTRTQIRCLMLGFKPREMEDKWFIFAEEGKKSGGKEEVEGEEGKGMEARGIEWEREDGGVQRDVDLVLCRSWTGRMVARVRMRVFEVVEEEVGELAEDEDSDEDWGSRVVKDGDRLGGFITSLVFEGDEGFASIRGEMERKRMVREALRWVMGVELFSDCDVIREEGDDGARSGRAKE